MLDGLCSYVILGCFFCVHFEAIKVELISVFCFICCKLSAFEFQVTLIFKLFVSTQENVILL